MTARKKLLVTDAGGRMAKQLLPGLARSYDIKGIDLLPVDGIDSLVADVRDLAAIRDAFAGVDAVVDFANDPDWRQTWDVSYGNNIPATYTSLLAAQDASVKRYVYTSSNHVVAMYERDEPYASIIKGEYAGIEANSIPLINARMPVRPDSTFGIAKAASEATVRHFADKFGMSNICLRLGTALIGDKPEIMRQFCTLITPRDLLHLYECAIEAPADLKFATFFGISNNKWKLWDTGDARDQIGFRPQDNAERWRDKVAF